jgi:AraC-like DNA-binding protein
MHQQFVVEINSVRAAIAKLLSDGHPNLEQVAAELKVSPRTLQRHLSHHGISHSQLVDQVRQEYASNWLHRSPMSVGEIAQRLGYSDAGSFTRAFERWTGVSPREFRKGAD